jgi:NADH-quinone oxidoreductase subunit N
MLSHDLFLALPELILCGAAIVLLMVGAFAGRERAVVILWLAVLAMVAAAAAILFTERETATAFNNLFVVDPFGDFMKLLTLLGATLTTVLSLHFIQREEMLRFEFPVLLLFATLGMMLMVSAHNLISLYMGLELQSLSLYVVAAFRRDSLRSSEAGLKYFVLGALSSGMLLYGASMIYGFTGTVDFGHLGEVFAAAKAGGEPISLGLIVGLVFLLAGLCFKIAAVPFHMWTPDVYEGAPTAVTAFFAAAPKLAAMALLMRVLLDPFGPLLAEWRQIIWAVAVASMALAAFAAIAQSNIKRLMAYSSIGHIGYALIGLAAGTAQGAESVLVYLAIYMAMTVGTFAVILSMRRKGRLVEGIEDLRGLARTQPMMALALAVFMFSMAGIPPLAGFFAKLYIFLAAVETGLYVLAVLGVLSSVVGAYYYLRIVKLMYFDEPEESFDRPIASEVGLILTAAGIVIALFAVLPGPLFDGAAAAAQSLVAP